MKNYKFPLLILTFVFLLISTNSNAQETIYVTLNVDTKEVKTDGAHNYCYFDNQPESLDTRDYTINANVGDVIVWNAVSTSSERDQVKIVSINHEGGTNVFNTDKMNGQNGVVSGTITKNTVGKADYKYTVAFKVMSNGSLKPGTFRVDPKIKVGSH